MNQFKAIQFNTREDFDRAMKSGLIGNEICYIKDTMQCYKSGVFVSDEPDIELDNTITDEQIKQLENMFGISFVKD